MNQSVQSILKSAIHNNISKRKDPQIRHMIKDFIYLLRKLASKR